MPGQRRRHPVTESFQPKRRKHPPVLHAMDEPPLVKTGGRGMRASLTHGWNAWPSPLPSTLLAQLPQEADGSARPKVSLPHGCTRRHCPDGPCWSNPPPARTRELTRFCSARQDVHGCRMRRRMSRHLAERLSLTGRRPSARCLSPIRGSTRLLATMGSGGLQRQCPGRPCEPTPMPPSPPMGGHGA